MEMETESKEVVDVPVAKEMETDSLQETGTENTTTSKPDLEIGNKENDAPSSNVTSSGRPKRKRKPCKPFSDTVTTTTTTPTTATVPLQKSKIITRSNGTLGKRQVNREIDPNAAVIVGSTKAKRRCRKKNNNVPKPKATEEMPKPPVEELKCQDPEPDQVESVCAKKQDTESEETLEEQTMMEESTVQCPQVVGQIDNEPTLEEPVVEQAKPDMEKVVEEALPNIITPQVTEVTPTPEEVHPSSSSSHSSEVEEEKDEVVAPLALLPLQTVKPKRKKNKGRNGNIYIGVANRIEWFRLQDKFGFDNVNAFGTFVMEYMQKVHDDFNMLHQVVLGSTLFEDHGLSDFQWLNGLPRPVDEAGNFLALPQLPMTEETSKRIFELTYDLALKRGEFLVELSQKIAEENAAHPNQSTSNNNNFTEQHIGLAGLQDDGSFDLEVKQVMDEMLELQGKIEKLEEEKEMPVLTIENDQEKENPVQLEDAKMELESTVETEAEETIPVENQLVVVEESLAVPEEILKEDAEIEAMEVDEVEAVATELVEEIFENAVKEQLNQPELPENTPEVPESSLDEVCTDIVTEEQKPLVST